MDPHPFLKSWIRPSLSLGRRSFLAVVTYERWWFGLLPAEEMVNLAIRCSALERSNNLETGRPLVEWSTFGIKNISKTKSPKQETTVIMNRATSRVITVAALITSHHGINRNWLRTLVTRDSAIIAESSDWLGNCSGGQFHCKHQQHIYRMLTFSNHYFPINSGPQAVESIAIWGFFSRQVSDFPNNLLVSDLLG